MIIKKENKMIDTKTMTMGELFGYMMASRRVTSNSTTVEVVSALVDTTRQAAENVAGVAKSLIHDFCAGYGDDYMECLTENPGEYVNISTGEVVSVPMIP